MQATELKVDQNSDEWFAARVGLITASNFGVLFMNGRNGKPSTTLHNLVIKTALERITGKRAETYRSAAMEWGNETEALAADRYEIRTGQELTECGFFKSEKFNTGASPDRLAGSDGLVQIKCPEPAAHLKVLQTGVIPTDYQWQMHGELLLADRQWNDFVSFNPDFPPDKQLIIIRLERDEDADKMIREKLHDFEVRVKEVVDFVNS